MQKETQYEKLKSFSLVQENAKEVASELWEVLFAFQSLFLAPSCGESTNFIKCTFLQRINGFRRWDLFNLKAWIWCVNSAWSVVFLPGSRDPAGKRPKIFPGKNSESREKTCFENHQKTVKINLFWLIWDIFFKNFLGWLLSK